MEKEKKTNGEGSIRYIEKLQKYEARFGCVNPLTEKFERKSFYSASKTDALRQGRNWVQDVLNGSMPAGRLTLGEWIDKWLEDFVEPGVKIKTYEKYKSCLNCYIKPNIGDILLTKLRTETVQALFKQLLIDGSVKKKPLSSYVVRNTRRYLMQCIDQAVKLSIVLKNPCRDTRPVKLHAREPNILSEKQVKMAIATLDNNLAKATDEIEIFWAQTLRMAVMLAIGTGMRAGEILGLPWYAVRLFEDEPSINVLRSLTFSNKARQFNEPKTKNSKRNIFISQYEVEALQAYMAWQNQYKEKLGDVYKDQGLVFTTTVGTPLDYSKLSKLYRDFRKQINAENIRFHDLRHTHASLMLLKGVNPKVVQERLGHTTITMTLDTYSHLIPAMQQTAATAVDGIFSQ